MLRFKQCASPTSCLLMAFVICYTVVAVRDDACKDGCGETTTSASVCGSDGRTYQSDCIARCQGVEVLATGRCAKHPGDMLAAKSSRVTKEQMDRFKAEGFKLMGHGKAKMFDPSKSAAAVRKAVATATKTATAEQPESADRLVQAVRYTADGMVYIASLTKKEAAQSVAAAANGHSEGYIPPGMAVADMQSSMQVSRQEAANPATRKMRAIFSPDDRKEITFSSKYPYSAIGHLTFNDPAGGAWQCSGSMISARTVLTAAHCVFDRDTNAWQKNFRFSANQYSGTKYPYSILSGAFVTTLSGYTSRSTRNPWPYDIAIVQLDGAGATLGNRTGYLGLQYGATFSGTLETAGYPGDKKSGTFWYTSCDVNDKNGNDGQITNYCDIYGGQSGSPMFVNQSGSYNVRGVVSYESTDSRTGAAIKNTACEITASNYNFIMSWR